MKKYRLKKGVKISLIIIISIILLVVMLKAREEAKIKQLEAEKELVYNYVECLKNNHTQRDFCARELKSNYYYLDQLIYSYGYDYKQVGYDLYIIEK